MSRMPLLPKRLVTSLTSKLDIGTGMHDTCGASGSLHTDPVVLEGVKRLRWIREPPPPCCSVTKALSNANC